MDPVTAAFVRFRDRGDLDALGRVFDSAAPRLLALALHVCGNAADAEDTLQATFVIAMQKAAGFDASSPVGPWLAGILANEARSAARRTRRGAPAADTERTAGGGDPAADAERRELVATLRTHIEALPAEQRQVLLLQLQYGLQPAEIAEIVGAPPGTVRMRLHRGLQALRGVLPASLVAAFAALLPSRGIAAVRGAVMRAAARDAAAVAGAVTAVAGGVAMKKGLVASVAVALGVVAWWIVVLHDASPPPAVRIDVAATMLAAASDDARASALRREAGAPQREPSSSSVVTERVAAVATHGSLRVAVRGDEWYEEPGVRVAESTAGSGAPMADVAVVVRPRSDSIVAERVRRARTHATGELMFLDLPAGRWLVTAELADGGRGHVDVVIEPGTGAFAEIHVGVQTVEGIVVDAHGAPVAGAEVVAADAPDDDGRWGHDRVAAVTGADGRFRCVFTDGENRIGARKAGYASSMSHPTRPVATGDVQLVLHEQPGAVAVEIRGVGSTSMADVRVVVECVRRTLGRAGDGSLVAPPIPVSGNPDADGRFVAGGLSPAVHRVGVFFAGMKSAAAVQVLHGEVANVAVDLHCGLVVRGRVVGERGEPRSGVALGVISGSVSRGARTDEDGAFVVSGVARVPLRVIASRSCSEVEIHVEPPATGDVECTLVLPDSEVPDTETVADEAPPAVPSGSVRGRALDARGAPLADATAALEGAECSLPSGPTVGADGTFRFEAVRDGTFHLKLRAPGHVALDREVTLERDQQLDVGDVVLAPCAELRVRFLRPDGTPWRENLPLPNLLSPDGRRAISYEHRIDADAVVLTGFPAGRYRVKGPDDELLTDAQTVDVVAGVPVELLMPTQVGRRVELKFPLSAPAAERDLIVEWRRLDGVVLRRSRPAVAAEAHELVVDWIVPVGAAIVEARTPGGRVTHRSEVAVQRGLLDAVRFTVTPLP